MIEKVKRTDATKVDVQKYLVRYLVNQIDTEFVCQENSITGYSGVKKIFGVDSADPDRSVDLADDYYTKVVQPMIYNCPHYYILNRHKEYYLCLSIFPKIGFNHRIAQVYKNRSGKYMYVYYFNDNLKELEKTKHHYKNYYNNIVRYDIDYSIGIEFLYKTAKGVYENLVPTSFVFTDDQLKEKYQKRIVESKEIKNDWFDNMDNFVMPMSQKDHLMLQWVLKLNGEKLLGNKFNLDRNIFNFSFECGFDDGTEKDIVYRIKKSIID